MPELLLLIGERCFGGKWKGRVGGGDACPSACSVKRSRVRISFMQRAISRGDVQEMFREAFAASLSRMRQEKDMHGGK